MSSIPNAYYPQCTPSRYIPPLMYTTLNVYYPQCKPSPISHLLHFTLSQYTLSKTTARHGCRCCIAGSLGANGKPPIEDECWEIPLEKSLARALRLNPDILRDITSPRREQQDTSSASYTWSDFNDGSVFMNHPLLHPRGGTRIDHYVAWLFYFDGLGVNNPIGAFHNNHNLGCGYAICVNLHPAHRMALHNIFLVHVALKSDYVHHPARSLVFGRKDEPTTSSSFGMSMRRQPAA